MLDVSSSPAVVELDVAAFGQSSLSQTVHECNGASTTLGVIFAGWHQHTDPPHPLALLPARRERPRRNRASNHFDELAPLHSITSSASASSLSGIWRPSILAVLRLITSSNLVGC